MMDWVSIRLSATLALTTLAILMPLAIVLSRWLAVTSLRGKPWIEGLLALPLVLPPTVIGYYLLVLMGSQTALGQLYERLAGHTLASHRRYGKQRNVAASPLGNQCGESNCRWPGPASSRLL